MAKRFDSNLRTAFSLDMSPFCAISRDGRDILRESEVKTYFLKRCSEEKMHLILTHSVDLSVLCKIHVPSLAISAIPTGQFTICPIMSHKGTTFNMQSLEENSHSRINVLI